MERLPWPAGWAPLPRMPSAIWRAAVGTGSVPPGRACNARSVNTSLKRAGNWSAALKPTPPLRRSMNCACSWTGWTRAYAALSCLKRDLTTHEPDRFSAPVSHSAGVYPLPPGSVDPATAATLVWPADAVRAMEAVSGTPGPEPRPTPAPGPGKPGPGVHQVRPDPVDPPRSAARRHRHRTGLPAGQGTALPLR